MYMLNVCENSRSCNERCHNNKTGSIILYNMLQLTSRVWTTDVSVAEVSILYYQLSVA